MQSQSALFTSPTSTGTREALPPVSFQTPLSAQAIRYEPEDEDAMSSESSSEHEHLAPRQRAPKFAPGPVEANCIFYQLCTEVPWTYSRNSMKPCWIRHLKALKRANLCIEIPMKGYKTLIKWTTDMCKKRVAFRAKEKRTSGLATIAPPAVIDTVADYWTSYKVATGEWFEAFCNCKSHTFFGNPFHISYE